MSTERGDELQKGMLLKKRLLAGKDFIPQIVAWLLFFLLLNFLAGKYYMVISGDVYPSIHLVMEFVIVIVAICASLMSWYDYKYKHELRMLILSLTFCVVALVEFAHAVSYAGMPDFITPSSPNKASTYWIIARLLLSTGLLVAVFSKNKVKIIRKSDLILALFALLSLGLIVAVALYLPHLPAMYDTSTANQTSVKIALEYAVMIMLGLAAVRLLLKKELNRQDFHLFLALIIGIMSDATFTLYDSVYDTYNLLGHIYLVASFVFIFKALTEEAVGMLYEAISTLKSQREMLAETNRQLQETDRIKDEFLANTSHELRSPLTAVIAFTELLMDESSGELNDLQRDYVHEINDSGRELLGMINGFLDLSKIAAGKTFLYREHFKIDELIEDIFLRMKHLFNNKGITLEVARNKNQLPVWADREKTGQVLTNLLSNALKFTTTGGKVVVESNSGDSGRDVIITVRDTGIGIDIRDQEKIFQPFYQVDGTSTRNYGGMGIGLNLAKKLVELHGGTIRVSSQQNAGSIFTFTLPTEETRDLRD
jgi:signal transduction histidine kinase